MNVIDYGQYGEPHAPSCPCQRCRMAWAAQQPVIDCDALAAKIVEKLPVEEIARKMLEIYLNTPFDRVYDFKEVSMVVPACEARIISKNDAVKVTAGSTEA